jgi:hypothetical protein
VNRFIERCVATRQGFKPREVEEPIDYYWHRPVAGLLVQILERTTITSDQVTFASGIVSLLSGSAMALGAFYGKWWVSIGGVLLFCSIILDCADGQLARVRGKSSIVGRALDGTMDTVAPVAVFCGITCYMLVAEHWPHVWVWPLGLAAGGSLAWHVVQYDVIKNIYLHATRPDFSLGGNTLLSIEDMREFQRDFESKGERFNAWLMKVWMFWTTPQLEALEPWSDPSRTPRNDAERALFKKMFGRQMRAFTWIGFGTHLFVLGIAALLAPLDSRVVWVAYAVILVPMNLVAVSVLLTRAGRVTRFTAALAAMREKG